MGEALGTSADISEYFFVDSWFLGGGGGGFKSIFDTQDKYCFSVRAKFLRRGRGGGWGGG